MGRMNGLLILGGMGRVISKFSSMERLLPEKIQTERLRLRAPSASDAHAIFAAYAQDPVVCRYMIWRPHKDKALTENFISRCIEVWQSGDIFPYVITKRGSNDLLGMLEARIQGSKIDIGYVLARQHWGNGFMPEAILTLSQRALAQPNIFRVQASCDVDNIPSQRALEKAGFFREGRLERYTIHPNLSTEPRACFMYACCC